MLKNCFKLILIELMLRTEKRQKKLADIFIKLCEEKKYFLALRIFAPLAHREYMLFLMLNKIYCKCKEEV